MSPLLLPGQIVLKPLLYRFDKPDLESGAKFSDLNEPFLAQYGVPIMTDLPRLGLRFSDTDQEWELIDDQGTSFCRESYSQKKCISWTGFGSCEVVVICGQLRNFGPKTDCTGVQVFIYDHASNERVHLMFALENGKASDVVGLCPAIELKDALLKGSIPEPLATLPKEFTPEVFRTTYLVQHFGSASWFDFRSVRISEIP